LKLDLELGQFRQVELVLDLSRLPRRILGDILLALVLVLLRLAF